VWVVVTGVGTGKRVIKNNENETVLYSHKLKSILSPMK
jgi:hypothetical protein